MKSLTVLILKGLPASGKSDYALKLLKDEPGKWKRVNKDLLRLMLDGGKWSGNNEKFVLEMRDDVILSALSSGKNVIVDDTNLDPVHEERIRALVSGLVLSGKINHVNVEVKFIDTPLKECIERDSKRQNYVGERVIRKMYNQYLRGMKKAPEYDSNLPSAILCDLDGTLALHTNRSPYDAEKCDTDEVNRKVLEAISGLFLLSAGAPRLILVSARGDQWREKTEQWLRAHEIHYFALYMRKEGDEREDSIVKEELYNAHIRGKYNVRVVFDDRDRVVDMWRALGLTVFQVADGAF